MVKITHFLKLLRRKEKFKVNEAVLPQTAEVISKLCKKWVAKMVKGLNLWVKDK